MDKVVDVLLKIQSQELFTALMLGVILLIGAFAHKIGLVSAAGAFLMGMIINSYDVEDRLHRTVSAFKDIFLVVFFISFGMLLDPTKIPGVLWMVAIVVPVTILGELVATSSSAFLSGFSSKSAVAIGAGMIARGEYSMIYASLGYSLNAISEPLYQFTGVYVFIMTLLAPVAMKNSNRLKSVMSTTTPDFIKYSTKLVSVTLKPFLLPEEVGVEVGRDYRFLTHFGFYLVVVTTILGTSVLFGNNPYIILPLAMIGVFLVYRLSRLFAQKIKTIEEQIDYHAIHQGAYNLDTIVRFISRLFSAFLTIVILGVSFWSLGYLVMVCLVALFVLYLMEVSFYVYRRSVEA